MTLSRTTQKILKWIIGIITALAVLEFVSQLGHAQTTTTTITGVVKGLDNTAQTSGKIVFSLQPSFDTTISGTARFTPGAITCKLTASGIKANDNVSACVITKNTSLVPAGSFYRVDICPLNVCTSRISMFAISDTLAFDTVVPTPTTGPVNSLVDTFSNQSAINGDKTFLGTVIFSGSIGGTANFANAPTLTLGLDSLSRMKLTEITDPACGTGFDFIWASSVAHRVRGCDNNGAVFQYAHAGVDINTLDQVTATHLSGVTTNVLQKANATGNLVNSGITDDGVNLSMSLPVQQTGKTTIYNNTATVANGIPSEVSVINLTGQTANIGSTTLYSIPASGAGIYRITVYIIVTTIGTTSTMPNVVIAFTDPDNNTAQSVPYTVSSAGNTLATLAVNTLPLSAKASTNINYSTTSYASTGTAMQYALHIKVEYLGN